MDFKLIHGNKRQIGIVTINNEKKETSMKSRTKDSFNSLDDVLVRFINQ